jgi:hypothetical protein
VSRTDMYTFGCIICWLYGGIVCVLGVACLRDHTAGCGRKPRPLVGGALSRYVLM